MKLRLFWSGCAIALAVANGAFSATKFSQAPYAWQLDNVDIRVVIQHIAKLTGKNILVDPRVQGKVQLSAHHVRTQDEIYALFLSTLTLLGYAYQEQGATLQIFPAPESRMYARVDRSAPLRLQAFPVQHLAAQDLLTALRPLIPESVVMSLFKPANHLLCVGDAAALQNIQRMIALLDRPPSRTQDVVRTYALAHTTVQAILPLWVSLLKKYHEGAIYTAIAGDTTMLQDYPAPAQALAATPAVTIIAQPLQQTLVVSATDFLQKILNDSLAALDQPPRQVLVEALIAQVDSDALDELGFEWGSITPEKSGLTATGLFQQGVGVMRDHFFGTWQSLIHALAQQQQAEIIARPAIMVLNQHAALIEIGQRVSVQQATVPGIGASVGSAGATGSGAAVPFNTFARENVSLLLQVTPQINQDRSIQMTIQHTNNTLMSPQNPGVNPQVNMSNLNTSVLIQSGEMIVLGGIIQKQQQTTRRKIPFLGDLPVIGKLFQVQMQGQKKKYLLIFLRPFILSSNKHTQAADEVT